VPNVSEGRDAAVLGELADACGASLLDLHRDPDHHRSVFTLAGPHARDAEDAVRALARAAIANIDLDHHDGVHPRFGALDVVPFVALTGSESSDAVDAAHRFGVWAADTLGTPVFYYGDADRHARPLPSVRSSAFRTRAPDIMPSSSRRSAGAIAVGARPLLVAVNCDLVSDDRALARRIATAVRERDGGLPGVRALGLWLPTRGQAQVSMNLVDLPRTGIEVACEAVRDLAHGEKTDVARVELVSLMPEHERVRCSARFLAWSGLGADLTIEARLAARG
jgi:glutamate formiminotransferase / 5-formyltetrahydrofolate cyclo-ligase